MIRRDSDRLLEAQFLQETRILRLSNSLQKYYSTVNQNILEFLNPDKSYEYQVVRVGNGYLFKVERISNDPQFIITLKQNGTAHVLDFYWPETEKGFNRIKGLDGTQYLDTLAKVIQTEILPMLEDGKLSKVIFAPYQADSAGELREKVFNKLVEKFVDKEKFAILKKQDFTVITNRND